MAEVHETDTLVTILRKKLTHLFSQDKRIVAVYLFGSQADGSAYQRSDLDIGIMIDPGFEKEFTLDDEIDLEVKIESILKTEKFDLVVLNKVPLVMQFRIIAPAKLIYVHDDDKRCEIEVQIMQQYWDFLPRLREFNREYFEALTEEYSNDRS